MKTRMLMAVVLALGLLPSASAHAVALTLGADGPEPAMEEVDVLYASRSDGMVAAVAEAGESIPGGKLDELGVPFEMSDGRVLFGAEIVAPDGKREWTILIANPDSGSGEILSRAIAKDAASPRCTPRLRQDPAPVADSRGTISFIAPEASGGDAVFEYYEGELSCVARTGERIGAGDELQMFQFGSLRPVGDRAVVMNAYVRQTRGAHGARVHTWHNDPTAIVVIAPGARVREIAVEGDRAPGGGRFGTLGAVSASLPMPDAKIAFTDASPSGHSLYSYEKNQLHRVAVFDPGNDSTPTWFSPGRPAIAIDGSMAVRAAHGTHEQLLLVARDGSASEIAGVGDRITGFGRFDGFTDPIFAAGGVIFFGASDVAGEQAIFSANAGGAPSRMIEAGAIRGAEFDVEMPLHHALSGTTMSVTPSGAFSYLGGR